jgi:hypothetical protein
MGKLYFAIKVVALSGMFFFNIYGMNPYYDDDMYYNSNNSIMNNERIAKLCKFSDQVYSTTTRGAANSYVSDCMGCLKAMGNRAKALISSSADYEQVKDAALFLIPITEAIGLIPNISAIYAKNYRGDFCPETFGAIYRDASLDLKNVIEMAASINSDAIRLILSKQRFAPRRRGVRVEEFYSSYIAYDENSDSGDTYEDNNIVSNPHGNRYTGKHTNRHSGNYRNRHPGNHGNRKRARVNRYWNCCRNFW